MKHLQMKKIALDYTCRSTNKHLSELISSFHGTLEWLCLGTQRTIKRDSGLLELISTLCTRLTHLDVTLDDVSSGAQVLAAFASDRLPLLKFLSLGTDMYAFSEPDIDIEDADAIDICRYHPRLEVLTVPLGERTTLASCAAALSVCPNLMHISTKGYEFKVERGYAMNCRRGVSFYAADETYCVLTIKAGALAVMESDVRTIKASRPLFPICRVRCIQMLDANLLVTSEVLGRDLMELELLVTDHEVEMTCFVKVLNNCSFIRSLRCTGSHISDNMLMTIADHAEHVHILDFSARDLVSDAGVVYLLEKLGSRLEILIMSNRQISKVSLVVAVTHQFNFVECPQHCTILTRLAAGADQTKWIAFTHKPFRCKRVRSEKADEAQPHSKGQQVVEYAVTVCLFRIDRAFCSRNPH